MYLPVAERENVPCVGALSSIYVNVLSSGSVPVTEPDIDASSLRLKLPEIAVGGIFVDAIFSDTETTFETRLASSIS